MRASNNMAIFKCTVSVNRKSIPKFCSTKKSIENNKGITIIVTKDGSLSWQLNYEASEKLDDSSHVADSTCSK